MHNARDCHRRQAGSSEELLSQIAHDIRNPLAAVVNGVQILRQAGTNSPLAEPTLDLVERQLGHVVRLIQDLLQPGSSRQWVADGKPEATSAPGMHHGPLQLLVVEDNRDVAKSLTSLLRLWGHEVWVAYDGLEALGAAGRHQPQMVLLDLELPGLDGYGVAARLRAESIAKNLRIIAVTAFGDTDHSSRVAAGGFDAHLVKPVAPWALKHLIASLAAQPAGEN